VRYDREGARAEIDLAVDVRHRGEGLGTALLTLSAERACLELGVDVLLGTVRADNVKSIRAFESAGFRVARHLEVHGRATMQFERPCGATPGRDP
jgi:RimJ/RimL family protein N-acetyltransferase